MATIGVLLSSIKETKRAIGAVTGKQVFSRELLTSLHTLANTYFSETRPHIASHLADATSLTDADDVFQTLASLSRKNPSKDKCLASLSRARDVLVRLEGLTLSYSATQFAGYQSKADEFIISTLTDLCPSVALSYQQALIDLKQSERHSWRGPATDLREALRETLDVLAPDTDVEKMPGYRHEGDAKRPTMKQKTRYILKNRGASSGQLAAPETAIAGLEDMLGGLTRSVYTRFNPYSDNAGRSSTSSCLGAIGPMRVARASVVMMSSNCALLTDAFHSALRAARRGAAKRERWKAHK